MSKILIAEDNRDFADMLKLALEAEGYDVRLAANGRDALLLQREAAACVLITDLVMPESDGFEAIDSFHREFPATKVIVVSGAQKLNAPRYLEAAKLIGADAALRKPFKMDELLDTLKRL